MANGDAIRITDGSLSFEGGIDSGRTPTIAGAEYPNGLKRNQLAWCTNATQRGGGILQRTGWRPIVKGAPWTDTSLFPPFRYYQGGWLYEPNSGNPYLMLDIGGRNWKVDLDTGAVTDVTPLVGPNLIGSDRHYFTQGEEFMIVQDGFSQPLVWDGATMQQISAVGGAHPKLPTGTVMDYFMGRIWVANGGRAYVAGDIVGTPGAVSSGTAPYQFRDSILNITENTLLNGGGAFVVPTNAGNIRAIFHTANLDTALGEGQLFVSSRKTIYSVNVVPDRAQWILLKEPLQRVAQLNFGTTSERSVVPVNGDVFLQGPPNGDIRSFALALRYFHQWGNVPISRNMNRVLRFNDRALLSFGSGIEFDNRLFQTVLPFAIPGIGVAHQGVMALDFDLISSFEEKLPPAWEGMYEGLDFLQLFSGDFGGLQRAFAVVFSRRTQQIEVWEMTQFDRFDSQVGNDGDRVKWYFESPAYTFQNPMALKQLETMELWIDKLLGTVEFEAYYRPDSYPCWIPWHAWKECTAKDCNEDMEATECFGYPTQPYCESFKATKTLPKPPSICIDASNRRSDWGYQFQVRLVIKGWCRVRGLLLHALPRDKRPFENMVSC